MMAVMATLPAFRLGRGVRYLAFRSWIEACGDEGGHVERLADAARPPRMSERPVQRPDCRAIGARPARLAAWPASRVPSSGIAISKAKAVMVETPGMLVRMSKRSSEARVGDDDLVDGGFDSPRSAVDLVEALSVLTFQQREASDAFPRFLAAVRSLTSASRAR